jgi:predicted XRE-type DNA-binding protein
VSGRKNFKTLRDQVVADPERRERVEEFGRAYDAVLGLGNLREARNVTQTQVARSLGVSQPNVSKIEGKEDIHLSTLHGYVEALGGHLEINAVFPDQTVNLTLPKGRKGQRTDVKA